MRLRSRIATGGCFVTWWKFGPYCSPTIDGLGHGTAVAAAAAGTNTGVAKGAWIHPIRVDDGGGEGPACDDLMAGTAWVLNNLQHPAVVNFSVGEFEGGCNGFRMLMEDLVEAGAVVTKAAGNSNVSAHIFTDNWAAGAIVTGGITPSDERWVVDDTIGSNFGNLVSMMGPSTNRLLATSTSNDALDTWRGTSFAAPMIAGVAALIWQAHPGYSAAAVRATILDSASAVTIGNGQGVANRVLYSRLIAPQTRKRELGYLMRSNKCLSSRSVYTRLLLTLVAGVSCDDPVSLGWCYIDIKDPLVAVERVVDAATKHEIAQVLVSVVSFNDAPLSGFDLADLLDPPTNVVLISDNDLQCDVPCGFGSYAGKYDLIISKEGYGSVRLIFHATFDHVGGRRDGCPLILAGGHKLRVSMQRD